MEDLQVLKATKQEEKMYQHIASQHDVDLDEGGNYTIDSYVLLFKNKTVGYVEMAYYPEGNGYCYSLFYINKAYRKRGFGKFLLNYIKDKYKNHSIWGYVNIKNRNAIKFYEDNNVNYYLDSSLHYYKKSKFNFETNKFEADDLFNNGEDYEFLINLGINDATRRILK